MIEETVVNLVGQIGVGGVFILFIGMAFFIAIRANTNAQHTLNSAFDRQDKQQGDLLKRIQTLEDSRADIAAQLAAAQQNNTRLEAKILEQSREIKRLEQSIDELKTDLAAALLGAGVSDKESDAYQVENARLKTENAALQKQVEELQRNNLILRKPPAPPAETQPIAKEDEKGVD